MMMPAHRVRILVATQPVDFRKGHDGLAALVQPPLTLGWGIHRISSKRTRTPLQNDVTPYNIYFSNERWAEAGSDGVGVDLNV